MRLRKKQQICSKHRSILLKQGCHLWLVVVLQRHGDDINADNEGDDQVQVVAGTQSMDSQACRTIGCIVGQLLCLWIEEEKKKRQLGFRVNE